MMLISQLRTILTRYKAWLFPAALLIILLLLTSLKISGTSVGQFNTYLGEKQHGLLFNKPQMIRSDEWEVSTPLTVSQAANKFPRFNEDIGNGQDVSIAVDVPYKEWSTIFRPQNWIFFVLPIEYAFAFKWWLIGALLMLGCYLLCLELLPKKYLIASLVAVSFFLSPFVQWWYQSGTLSTLYYCLFIIVVSLRLLKKDHDLKRHAVLSGLLAYLITAFGVILYVPFLLPCVMVSTAFLAGQVANTITRKSMLVFLKRSFYIAGAAVIAIVILGVFLKTRTAALSSITGTVYPGDRKVVSGGFSAIQLFSGAFGMYSQYANNAAHMPLNQSEASNFMLLFPFLVPAVVWIKKRRVDWRMVFLLGVFGLFCLHLFVPKASFIASLTGLNLVPHTRLLMGVGLLNILLLIITIQTISERKAPVSRLVLWGSTSIAFLATLLIGYLLSTSIYQGYVQGSLKVLLISAIIATIVALLLKRRFIIALSLLIAVSFVSVWRIHPLYQGLDPLLHSRLAKDVTAIGRAHPDDGWVVGEHGVFENFALVNGFPSVSGVYAYPQLDLWRTADTNGKDEAVYNRYAHVFFTLNDSLEPTNTYFDPPALDAFRVHTSPCSDFLRRNNVRYILIALPLTSSCLTEVKVIPYPSMTMRVYEIH